jgi:hypothetical protein
MSAGGTPTKPAPAGGWLNDQSDDAVLRWLLRVLVVATVAVVGVDYYETRQQAADIGPASATPAPGDRADDPGGAAMSFDLVAGGRLMAKGSIEAGAAERFAAEIAKRGSYVTTVVLNSPGGSLEDALAMGRLIREKGMATQVEAGATCASSCPLVFAGGVERRAGAKAAIGVHQAFAAVAPATMGSAAGMANAQRVSARCQKYLQEMGVDPALWIHAMETPPARMYFLSSAELMALRLATLTDARRRRKAMN